MNISYNKKTISKVKLKKRSQRQTLASINLI